jgi:type IV pilus assembly protein PilY1
VHGDVLHSRPAVVNYNRVPTETNSDIRDSDIYVYYGSNDGLLRAVKGGTVAATTGPDAQPHARVGALELHSDGILPARLKRLRDQLPAISSAAPKDYFFDGSIGVYFKDAKGSGNVASP